MARACASAQGASCEIVKHEVSGVVQLLMMVKRRRDLLTTQEV